jgi:serine/threonine protein kinase
MNTEPIANRCPKCQALLPANAPLGLCAKCLLAAVATPTEAGQPADRKPPPPIATVATAFPQLEILELIGHGGMGVVYKARQPRLDRLVALKLLPQSLAADAAFAERFNREARLLGRLNHPNIVTVHDFGQSGGFFYLLMEFVDGVNLRQAMQAGRFTPQQAMMLVPKICEALQFAHDEGILHRDIKPENILLDTKGRVKIADFGIAKLIGEAREKVSLTGSGLAVGTPHYMAPEQLEHPQDVDQRADIYSLGVVFYEMLTGELPIGRFAPPSQKSNVDARVDEVVFHALEKEREKRFRSAGEVKTSVEAITSNPAATPPQAAAPPPGLGAAIPERRIPCYISTPEHLSTFTGQVLYIYTGKGELRLDAENLTFVSNWQSSVIPLRDIRELGIGHYSRLAKPVRLDYLAVTFEQAGQRRTLLFTPMIRGGIALPWEVNPLVADCLRAVREAVIARTGQAPAGPAPSELPDSYALEGLWRAIKIVLVTAAVCAVVAWLKALVRGTGTQKTWEGTTGGWIILLVSGAVLLFFIAMSVRDSRARRKLALGQGTCPSEPPASLQPGHGPSRTTAMPANPAAGPDSQSAGASAPAVSEARAPKP